MKFHNRTFDILIFSGLMLILTTLISCTNTETNPTSKVITSPAVIISNQIIGEKFTTPDSISLYQPFKNYLLDSNSMFNSKLKLYSFVNVSCSTCLDEIIKWNQIAIKLNKYKVPVLLFVQTKDRFEMLKFLAEEGKISEFPYPFILDLKHEFFTRNQFLKESDKLYTILVNKNDEIVWVGNLLHSEEEMNQLILDINATLENK